jgi:penicillin-binding protein-related factor A (putative recombinase)
MQEKDFALEIKKSIEKQLTNCHYHKIPDQIYNPKMRFNPEKKYDAYVVWKSNFTALEYKFHTSSNAFNFSSLTQIQRFNLLDVKRAGGKAYVVIGLRYNNIKSCYFIDIEKYINIEKTSIRKSLPLNELEKFDSCKWIGSGEWELRKEMFLYGKR